MASHVCMNARDPAADSSGDPPEITELVGRAAAGDRDAFRELVHAYRRTIFQWAAVMLGDLDEAEDVTQLVLVRAHAGLAEYRGGARFATWLYSITRNVLSEQRRVKHRRASLMQRRVPEVQELCYIDENQIDEQRLFARVLSYLAELPPRQREIFQLADLQGFAPAEIAEMLGTAQVTIRTNLLKARRSIRSRILDEEPRFLEEYRS